MIIPAVWPEHLTGNNRDSVSRIREAGEFNTLTFDLGGRFNLDGMALWNSTEAGQTDRGFEGTRLSYSTDGGNTFSGSDLLTWTELAGITAPYGPEVQMLPGTVNGVTHVRMVVDNFSAAGSNNIVMASELRFLGQFDTSISFNADLSAETLEGKYNMTQGVEGGRDIRFTVTLSETNSTGSPITFDLDDLGTGNAISGVDYVAIAADAKIVVPPGANTGSLVVNVIDDFSIEATETLNVQISGTSYPSVVINTPTATGTINDNDDAGVTLVGANSLDVSEAGDTDTYTIALDTIPIGVVQITATAESQLQLSTDGINFSSTLDLSFTDMTPLTITVRAIDDQSVEDLHNGTITHAITGTVVDANYPDVTPDDLYTVNGTDRTFQELLDDGALRPGINWAGGVRGSEIDVNNAVLEQGIPSNLSIPQNINAHSLNSSVIGRSNFDNITRWYQEDGKTQIFRLFEGEENVRNDRALAARIETFTNAGTAVWNDFSIRYTVMKGESVSLFQNKQASDAAWGLHVGMTPDGDIHYTHRRNPDGGSTRFTLAEDMIGKSFEILVRDNGHDYELYFNGELITRSFWERPGRSFSWRWGPYRGARTMDHDVLVFANNLQMIENTSSPVGLTPYRLPTTSLSIDSATAEITDNDLGIQLPFVDQAIAPGTILLAEEFDLGGQLIAYNDTTLGNSGNNNEARRFEDVDLNAGSIFAYNIADGEWLEFTRDVVPGMYDVNVNAWSGDSNVKGVRLLIATDVDSNSFTELGSVLIPDTDNERLDFTIPDVDLTPWAGESRVLRVEFFAEKPEVVIAPTNATLEDTDGSYLQADYGANGENWFNGSGLSSATIVETGDPIPAAWPTHAIGNSRDRVSRIRDANEISTLTLDLGGTFHLTGMALWNSTETDETDRGFENTTLSYSTDGGNTFTGSHTLTWNELDGVTTAFGPEVQSLPQAMASVTHVRMDVDNFSGGGDDGIVMASELRFLGKEVVPSLDLKFNTLEFISSSAPLAGDYNNDGSVDAVDYTVWRDTLGSTTDLRANGDNTGASAGKIDQADYLFWRANYGNTTVPTTPVPAPVAAAGEQPAAEAAFAQWFDPTATAVTSEDDTPVATLPAEPGKDGNLLLLALDRPTSATDDWDEAIDRFADQNEPEPAGEELATLSVVFGEF